MTAYHNVTKRPRIALTSVNCQTMTYFYKLPDTGTISKMLLNIKSVLRFSLQHLTERLVSDGLSATLPKINIHLHVKYRILWLDIH